jgi:outer membrane lipoprotein-sorting protein
MSPKAQKADKIIEKHVVALGGRENIDALRSLRIKGHLTGERFEVPFTLWMKRPNRSRMNIDVRGVNFVLAYDGETTWWVNPLLGVFQPKKMPGDYAKMVLRWTDFEGPLVDYKNKRHLAEYVGEVKTNTGKAHKIKLTLADGDVWHVYIDTETLLEVKRTFLQTFEDDTSEVTTYFPEFKTVNGVVLYRIVKGEGLDGSPYTMTFDTFEPNVEIDDANFSLP